MKRLMVEIEREVTRRFWNAVDRPEPIKWRRTVAGRVPLRRRCHPKEAQKRPNQPTFVLFYLGLRFLEAGALSTVHVLIDGSPRASRIGRAGPRRAQKCARDAPIWTLSNAHFILYLWITSFPTAAFCSTQLPSSSAVLGVLWDARGELVMVL